MDGSNGLIILIAFSLAALNAALAYGAWQHYSLPARLPLTSLLLASSWWLVWASLQILFPGSQLWWARIQYLAAAVIPTLWLLFALRYSGSPYFQSRRSLLFLAIEPALSILLTWISQPHTLLASQGFLAGGLFGQMVQSPAYATWLHSIYSISLSILGAMLVVRTLIHRRRAYNGLTRAGIIAALITSFGIILDMIGLDPSHPLPLTPVALAFSGGVVGLGMVMIRLLGLVPQACHTVFEHINDSVFVLDTSNRIIDLNYAACNLINRRAPDVVGLTVDKAWPEWPCEITWPFGGTGVDQDIIIPSRGISRSFALHISPLNSQKDQLRGRVIVLRDTTDQKRAEEALRRRDEILDAIGFATKQFMRQAALEEILPDVFARLGESTHVSRVYLLENHTAPDGQITNIYRHEWSAWGIQHHHSIPVLQAFSLSERGLARWADLLKRGQVIIDQLTNLPPSEQTFLKERDVRSLVVVPIFLEEKWWGSLGFEDCKTERQWSQIEIDALKTAADTIGGALQRRQAEEAVHRWADVIQTLLDLTVVIGSTMNIEQVLERVIQAARTLLPIDRAAILLWDEQQNALLPTQTTNGDVSYPDWPAEALQNLGPLKLTAKQIPLIGELQRRKEAIAIQTVADSPLMPAHLAQPLGILSLLAVPIFYHDRFTAVLYLDYTHAEHSFSRQEINLATALAQQAGQAIERARLYTQSQQDADELSALYQASSTLFTSGYDLQTLAKQITEVVTSEFDFAYCSVILVEKEHNRLRRIAQRGFRETSSLPNALNGPGLTVQAALTGEIIYAPDVTNDPRYLPISPRTRSEIVFPLKAGGEIIALLNLESPEPDAFDERSRRILTAFANDAALALQNVRLINAAQIHARQMALLNEITRTALLATDLNEKLNIISDRMNELIQSDHCYITIWDPEKQQVLPGGASKHMLELYQHWSPQPSQPTLTAAVLEAGEAIIVPDAQQSGYFLPHWNGHRPFQTLLGLPMIVGEQKLGAVLIGFNQDHAFTQPEVSICQQATGQVALAIAEAWSLESARQRAQEAETLRQAGAIVASTLKEDEAIQLIMQQLSRVVPCDSASVQILHDGFLEIVGGFGWPDVQQVIGLHLPVPGDNPNTQVVQQCQPVLLANAPDLYPGFLESPHAHIRSWLGVPLVLHNQVKGMLAMDSTQPDYFSLDQARLAAAFADQVAIVMENAHLYEQARQAAERRTVLHRVSQEIVTASFEAEKIYAAIHRASQQLMPTEAFAITLVTTDPAQAEAVYLVDKDGRAPNRLFPADQGLTGRVLAAGKTIHIPDVDQTPDLAGLHFGSQAHTRSVLSLPLRVGDHIIGMLSAQSYQPNAYTTEDQYLLEMLAATAAIAIENSRLLKEIQWLAITDPLTGLFNRRGLFELAEREVDRFRRFGRPFCVFMLDIDHFKMINDTYGHSAGDQVLLELANRLKKQIRDIDIIGRYGGEEILVVLPETHITQAMQAAERARHTVQKHPFQTDRGDIPVTISAGVAQFDTTIPNLASLVDRADSAMYAAKQTGRNRVQAYIEL